MFCHIATVLNILGYYGYTVFCNKYYLISENIHSTHKYRNTILKYSNLYTYLENIGSLSCAIHYKSTVTHGSQLFNE